MDSRQAFNTHALVGCIVSIWHICSMGKETTSLPHKHWAVQGSPSVGLEDSSNAHPSDLYASINTVNIIY